ncbi:uncharacterized protein LOC119264820 isoform X1 [Pygocentrus nattereri]|uniref:uncharacterized protein LOC119264820 isoform X1 n=1 Tax=Pygocentrus nattereri TaxID=42514 RepID=UPI0018915B39|nr:uncharacterized protein LOC119264820 isoform X1 [Pygocentrus nattereri]
MRSLRVTIVMLLSVVSGMLHVEITETGTEGNIAVILCPYSKVYESYTKYFCKGLYKDCETLLKSNGKDFWTSKDRIIMNDDTEQKKLVVTIRDLRMEDAGDYGCGIETTGRDPFTLVHLKVIKAPKPPKRTQSNPTRSSPPPPTKNNESHAPTISTNKTGEEQTVRDKHAEMYTTTGNRPRPQTESDLLVSFFLHQRTRRTGFVHKSIQKLQYIQSSAAGVLTHTKRSAHITPILSQLHWLLVPSRIKFKILLLTSKALLNLAPPYLRELLTSYTPSCSLRSSSNNPLAVPHQTFHFGREVL